MYATLSSPLPSLHTLTEVLQYRDHVVTEVESVQFLQWLQVLYLPDEVLV